LEEKQLIMKNIIISIIILGAATLTIGASDFRHTVSIREIGFPIVPSMSGAQYEFATAQPFGISAISSAKLQVWYLANSPYLAPAPFAEVGVLINSAVLQSERIDIFAGLGTGVAIQSENFSEYSVPLIAQVAAKLPVFSGFASVGVANRFFLYGDGFIYKFEIPLSVHLSRQRLLLQLSPGANFGHSWTTDESASALKTVIAIGWRWGEIRQ
jgi:hypothetical protein